MDAVFCKNRPSDALRPARPILSAKHIRVSGKPFAWHTIEKSREQIGFMMRFEILIHICRTAFVFVLYNNRLLNTTIFTRIVKNQLQLYLPLDSGVSPVV